MTHSGGKPHTNVGDKGQRYEVHGVMDDGTDEVFGWTEERNGGGLMKSAKLWPRYKDAYVVDRKPPFHRHTAMDGVYEDGVKVESNEIEGGSE